MCTTYCCHVTWAEMAHISNNVLQSKLISYKTTEIIVLACENIIVSFEVMLLVKFCE